jgi:hypothetical protein
VILPARPGTALFRLLGATGLDRVKLADRVRRGSSRRLSLVSIGPLAASKEDDRTRWPTTRW